MRQLKLFKESARDYIVLTKQELHCVVITHYYVRKDGSKRKIFQYHTSFDIDWLVQQFTPDYKILSDKEVK